MGGVIKAHISGDFADGTVSIQQQTKAFLNFTPNVILIWSLSHISLKNADHLVFGIPHSVTEGIQRKGGLAA